MGKVRILQGIFFLMAIFIAFLYINNPFAEIKELALVVDFFLGASTILLIIFWTTPGLGDIQLRSAREFFEEYSLGCFAGLGVFGLAYFLALSLDRVINLTGSVSEMAVQRMSDTALIFLVHVLPLFETVILVGITLVVGSFLTKRIPYPYLVGGVVASVVFAMFHFAAVAGPLSATPGAFEYSFEGFVDFVTSLDGALVHFSFGLVSVLIFLAGRSFVGLYSLHHVNNLLAGAEIVGWTDLMVTFAVVDVAIVLLTFSYARPWRKLNEFKFGRVFS